MTNEYDLLTNALITTSNLVSIIATLRQVSPELAKEAAGHVAAALIGLDAGVWDPAARALMRAQAQRERNEQISEN